MSLVNAGNLYYDNFKLGNVINTLGGIVFSYDIKLFKSVVEKYFGLSGEKSVNYAINDKEDEYNFLYSMYKDLLKILDTIEFKKSNTS